MLHRKPPSLYARSSSTTSPCHTWKISTQSLQMQVPYRSQHKRMGRIRRQHKCDNPYIRWSKELSPGEVLLPRDDSGERDDARPLRECNPLLPEAVSESSIAIPRAERVVRDQAKARDEREASPHPGRVRDAPQNLPPQLRVPGDPRDARFVYAQGRLLHGGDFEQVERGGVQQQERDEGRYVHGVVQSREVLHAPQLGAVVAVRDEVGDERRRRRERDQRKADAVQTLA